MELYIGLVHHPVYNKRYETIASAVTIFDLHDIARTAVTYNVKRFLVITPLEDQQQLVGRVLDHWVKGFGAQYNGNRKEALELIDIVPSIKDAMKQLTGENGQRPVIVATDARETEFRPISFENLRRLLAKTDPVLILFGTAWGLHRQVLEQADFVLEPVKGPVHYNHLSVRSATAIILDRLIGTNRR
ncbi:MAG TPA: RNA methyltransferase [Desulfobacteraceae bacterium]|nr:RNA methyltransferase [Desulfobacteraceae bacterium]